MMEKGIGAGPSADAIARLPGPAARTVDFVKDVQPVLEASCIKCHGRGKAKGGWFSQTVNGLSPGKPYTVEIRATSAAGNGPVTQVRFTTKR